MQAEMLSGYRVLDFTQVVAGPTVTRSMAEMGAEVIKIEIAPNGDLAHNLPYIRDGRSAYYVQQNRGKKSLCIDVKTEPGRQVLLDLVAQVDVVVEAFSPGVIGRLGLGYDVVRQINPEVVMCSVSAFGQEGPQSGMPGYDYIAQAYGGFTGLIGEENGSPYFPQLAFGDAATGAFALSAILAALLYRQRGGCGQYLDISLLDVYLNGHEIGIQAASASGGEMVPRRTGSQHFSVAPLGIFKAVDSYIVIAALGRQWDDLCKAMDHPEWIDDPRFIDNPARVANIDHLVTCIEGWLQDVGDDDEALRRLEAGRVPFAPVLTVEQVLELPQVKYRQSVKTIEDEYLGEFKVPASPLRFSAFPDQPERVAPYLGQHNLEILQEILGYDDPQIKSLKEQGIIQQRRPGSSD